MPWRLAIGSFYAGQPGRPGLDVSATTASGASARESLQIRREIGDRVGIALALSGLSRVALQLHDYPAAQRYGAEAWKLFAELENLDGQAESLAGVAAAAAPVTIPHAPRDCRA